MRNVLGALHEGGVKLKYIMSAKAFLMNESMRIRKQFSLISVNNVGVEIDIPDHLNRHLFVLFALDRLGGVCISTP